MLHTYLASVYIPDDATATTIKQVRGAAMTIKAESVTVVVSDELDRLELRFEIESPTDFAAGYDLRSAEESLRRILDGLGFRPPMAWVQVS
jgi:hypothetical protein